MSFPTIFGGKRIYHPNEKLSYKDECTWQLRNVDRRVARHVPNVFYKYKKMEMLTLLNEQRVLLRVTANTHNITAGECLQEDTINNLQSINQGYRAFSNVPNCPSFIQKNKKDLLAMIRQLGRPTFFMTFSAAETHWIDLLRHLLILRGDFVSNISDSDIQDMSFKAKSELIKSDPVICVQYFQRKVDSLMEILKMNWKMKDYFYRVEFQKRGKHK